MHVKSPRSSQLVHESGRGSDLLVVGVENPPGAGPVGADRPLDRDRVAQIAVGTRATVAKANHNLAVKESEPSSFKRLQAARIALTQSRPRAR